MTVALTMIHPQSGPRAGEDPKPPGPPFPAPSPRRPPRPAPQALPVSVSTVLNVPGPAAGPDAVLDRLLGERIVFLGREVDDELANRVCAQLLLLAAEDPERDIALYVNSPGGSVTAGMAIYDTMRLITPDVATWAVGFSASMGQFLLSGGTPGKRHALPHARIMMHQPSAGLGGNASDIAIRAGVFGAMKKEIAELIAEHTGQSFETITADSDRDRWFTATEARDYGLVDHVVTP